jgi:hypothetical protein
LILNAERKLHRGVSKKRLKKKEIEAKEKKREIDGIILSF